MEDRLRTLKLEDFEPLVGQTFTFSAPAGQEVETLLDHCRPLGGQTVADAVRGPFALVFTTETREVLPQQTVKVENAALGSLEIFVVPVGPDPKGRMQYEVIFT
ncbi:MAG TPA: hypothetical protein VGG06_16685 [Thermoanaerobaculia bacterium]|jgi:hypothetical protein